MENRPQDIVGSVLEATLARLAEERGDDPALLELARSLFDSGDALDAKKVTPALAELEPPDEAAE